MKVITRLIKRAAFLALLVILTGLANSNAQTYSMQISGCVATANRLEFDVFLSNAGPATMQINSTVIRLTFGSAILPTIGTNTITIGFVNDGNSGMPLVWPPNLTPAFTYTPSIRQFSVSTNTGTYLNGATCAAPNIPVGGSLKLGRFFIQNSQNFVAGASVGFAWAATSSGILYLNCSGTVSSAASLIKTLSPPCSLSIPTSGCAIAASIQSQIDNVCFGGTTGSATATSTGGVAPVTYSWSNGQTGETATGLAAGTYTVTATDANLCSSTSSAIISQPASALTTSTTASACDSYVWSVDGATYTTSGIYVVHTTSGNGCDITNTLNLTITPSTTNTTTASACDTYTWTANGQTYTTSGTYTSVTGCHTEILELTITPSTTNTTTASACDTYTWGVNSQTYTTSGTYTSVNGCHTEVLNLTITPSTSNTTTASACDTYTWGVNSQTYTASGTYTSVTGCHTEVLNLTITPSTSNTTTASACDTYTWGVNSQTYTTSGTYTSVTGCHTEILNLTITPSTTNTTTATSCGTYVWSVNSQSYTVSGTYTSVSGCHTEILILTITTNATNTTTASACDSYTWAVNSQTYTTSGTYTSVNGCLTEVLNLTITTSTSNTTTASACATYTWGVNSQTYTASGTYTSVSGCHTEILVLTITPNTSNTTTASACDTYTWGVNSQTYTTSGTYTSVSGCHTEVLNLTITPSTSNTTTATACGSYTWGVNSQTYTASGTYTSVSGCHTEILVLTITTNITNTTTASACDSYTWAVNSQTYTSSGTYTSVVGCLTEVLNLTITPSTSNTTTASACGSYTWGVNSQTYTASGTYTSVSGCHTEILVLTITPNTSNTTTASACGTYTWGVNSQTYTASGTYTSVSGCHTEILVLTITPITSNTTTASACGSYTWGVNSQTYTASGTYTSVSGCHTEILVLTITPNTSNTTSATACGTYTWAVNSQTYTSSGTYTSVSGCHTEILILTIVPGTSNTTTLAACDSYTWSVNSQTYTVSGTYTFVSDCHTEILNLTINPTPAPPAIVMVNNCNATTTLSTTATGSLLWSNGSTASSITVGVAGLYSVTQSVNGCTSSASFANANPIVTLSASASVQGSIVCFGGSTTVTISAAGGTPSYTGTGTFTQSAGSITYPVSDANGCSTFVTVTLTQPTKVEGTTTTTSASGCSVPDGTATVNATGGTPGYTYVWSDGQTTQTATGLVAGSYTVSITDAAGCSGSATAIVSGSGGTVGTPGAISGPAGACRNTVGIVYSVAPVAGATSYTWTTPSGTTGSSTTNSITLAFGPTFAGGFICVVANNACGTSANSCMNIPVIMVFPGLPSVISGSTITCGPGVFTFSTNSANATSYNWIVTGTGVFIVTGQGTNTITVSVPSGFAQGSVQVRGVNCNGISAVRGMTITGIPTHSNAVVGPSFICANGSATYSMPVVPGVTTYTWAITGDASVGSQSLTSTTSSAVFNFGPTWTNGTGSITVSNSCGSYTRTFAVRSVPNQPGGITGPGTSLCNLSAVVYSIAAVPGATSYTWTVPIGVSVVSTSPDGLTIVVNFTPAFTASGSICVTANNACGQGPARCYVVTARPGVPVISGPTSVCKNQSAVPYTIAPVAGATSYSWSIIGGASITPAGSSAIVNYNTALSTSAVIRANAINACGASQPGALAVAVSLLCRTAAEDIQSVNSAEFGTYPNPTSAKTTVSFTAVSKMQYSIKVSDLLGNTLFVDMINASEGYNSKEINMSDFAKGIYVLTLTAEDGNTQSKRVIVE